MKLNPIIALSCLALGTIIVFLILLILQREPESISISILDGTGLDGASILNAAYELSSELPVAIAFRTTESASSSITAMRDSLGDLMTLELRTNEIRMNGEGLHENELVSRLRTYSESARLTDSRPVILVAAYDMTSGEKLVALFQVLRDAGISHIVPRYTTKGANTTAQTTASPSSGL